MAGTKRGNPALFVAPDRVVIAGSFICNGGSDPTTIRGDGFTVTHAGTGLYTITLTDGKFAGCDCVIPVIADTISGTTRALVEGVPNTDVQSGFFQIETQSAAGTEADLSAPAEVHFVAILRNTSLTRRA